MFGSWRKKCYYCKKKISSNKEAKIWIINGTSEAVCSQCENHAREQAYGKSE